MKQYRYVKSNAFTSGSIPEQSSPTRSLSLGNLAACIFIEHEQLLPEQMQAIAAEHKGFVMEVVFCGQSDVADCKLTYYSSECEVEFCESNEIDIILVFSMQTADASAYAHTRVFAPKFGYLEDPATGSGNSAFANYLLSERLWNGEPITIEQGGNDRIFNSVKLKCLNGHVLFGGKATKKIAGEYYLSHL